MSQFQVCRRNKLSLRHATESYVTDCAQIVVYYWWAAQTALSADWDTMSVAWVVAVVFVECLMCQCTMPKTVGWIEGVRPATYCWGKLGGVGCCGFDCQARRR